MYVLKEWNKGMEAVCHNPVAEKAEQSVRILSVAWGKEVKEQMGHAAGSNSTSLPGYTPPSHPFVPKQCSVEHRAWALS